MFERRGYSEQIVGGIIVMHKTKFVIDFFEKVLEILNDDPYLFTDKYTTAKGENHRHDQSIMSLLSKIMIGSITIPDETYFIDSFGSATSNKYPIWATRRVI